MILREQHLVNLRNRLLSVLRFKQLSLVYYQLVYLRRLFNSWAHQVLKACSLFLKL